MTDDAMPSGAHLADQPLDATDTALLTEVAALYDVVDPVPADLVERVKFALALDEVFDEAVTGVARQSLAEYAKRTEGGGERCK